MPRISACVLACALATLPACSPPECAFQRINFSYLLSDTSDSLQPGSRAAAGFIIPGNPNMLLSGLTIQAYAASATDMTATIHAAQSLSDTPDAGAVVATGNIALPVTTTAPADSNSFPTAAFALAGADGTPTLQPNGVYFAVFTTATQAVTLGIATSGYYSGSYQTYGTSGWTASPESTERVALSLQSPPCND